MDPSQSDTLPNRIAEKHSLIWELDSILDRIDPGRLFPSLQPLEVELGTGDGSFLVDYAGAHRDRNFIGVERLLGRLRKMARKGGRAGLSNLRAIRIESSYFLEWLLPPHSVSALHIYFPDPWPKRKHWRRRLINERFPELAAQALAPRGVVYLRTDDPDYFEQMLSVFARRAFFQPMATPEELLRRQTDFEKEFVERGQPIFRAAYRQGT